MGKELFGNAPIQRTNGRNNNNRKGPKVSQNGDLKKNDRMRLRNQGDFSDLLPQGVSDSELVLGAELLRRKLEQQRRRRPSNNDNDYYSGRDYDYDFLYYL